MVWARPVLIGPTPLFADLGRANVEMFSEREVSAGTGDYFEGWGTWQCTLGFTPM